MWRLEINNFTNVRYTSLLKCVTGGQTDPFEGAKSIVYDSECNKRRIKVERHLIGNFFNLHDTDFDF